MLSALLNGFMDSNESEEDSVGAGIFCINVTEEVFNINLNHMTMVT